MKKLRFSQKYVLFFGALILVIAAVCLLSLLRQPKTTIASLSKLPKDAVLKEIRFVSGPAASEEIDTSLLLDPVLTRDGHSVLDGCFYKSQSVTDGELFNQYRDLFYEHPRKVAHEDVSAAFIGTPQWYLWDSVKLVYLFDTPEEEEYFVRLVFFEPFSRLDAETDGSTYTETRPVLLHAAYSHKLDIEPIQLQIEADESGAFSLEEVNRLGGGKKP